MAVRDGRFGEVSEWTRDHVVTWRVVMASLPLTFAAVLALSVAAQLIFKVKGYFGPDGWFAFGAVYGFLSCLAMVTKLPTSPLSTMVCSQSTPTSLINWNAGWFS